ncbi:MAG TPA: 50S ribosomal protein L25, partial [Stellaceae bacterium]
MADIVTIRAAARDRAGKGPARAARRSGRVPGVIYGEKQPPALISVDPRELLVQLNK